MINGKPETTEYDRIQWEAEQYRLAQAQKLLDLFEGAHGRPATTTEELTQWAISSEGRAAIAYDSAEDGTIIP